MKSPARYILVAALAATFAVSGYSQNTPQSVADGDWNAGETWSTGAAPAGSSLHAYIQGGYTVDFTSGTSANLSTLNIGSNQDASGASVGAGSAAGTLNITGGTVRSSANNVGAIKIATGDNATGTLNINGGTLSGTGTRTGVQIGNGNGAEGFLNISSGSVSLTGGIAIGNANNSTTANNVTGHLTISGGSLATSTASSSGIFYVGYAGADDVSATGTYTQTGGTVSIDAANYANYLAVGYATNSSRTANGTASITGGTFSGNIRVGRQAGSNGLGGGQLIIGPGANISGKDQAWQVSGNGEIVFELGSTTDFNAVDLTASTAAHSLSFTEAGAKITVDGSNLDYASGLGPITLFDFISGKGPDATSMSNVVFDYIGFDPQFAPQLEWTATSLQLNLNLAAVPEPSTYALIFGAAALGVVLVRRRRRSLATHS